MHQYFLIKYKILNKMEKYDLSMHLLGVNEYNLPPFKDARIRRFKSF